MEDLNQLKLVLVKKKKINKAVNTPTNRIITSMLSKERFLFLLRYGYAYVERKIELEDGTQGTELQKHIMRYQQMFASYAIRHTLDKGVKSGIIWNTRRVTTRNAACVILKLTRLSTLSKTRMLWMTSPLL